MHPAPNEVCVIGMGTGVTAGAAGLHDIDVSLLELEQGIVDGARLFADHNNSVHDNERVRIKVTDGRLYLNLNKRRFDVIISEPSNPWVAGTADLFTTDFYRIGASALRRGGIFAQWIQIYDLSSANLLTMMRSFGEVFPFVYFVATIPGTDGLLIGSREQIVLRPKQLARRLGVPAIAANLADPRVGIRSVADLLARIWLGPDEFREFIGAGDLHTDDLPIIAYEAPKDLYRNTRTDNTRLIVGSAKGVVPWLDLSDMTNTERDEFLAALRASYATFVPKRVARFYHRE
jgi:spermidine synthase